MPIYRLKHNDNRMFEQIFDQYNRLLYVLAYRYLKSNDEAEDAVQYTFMKLWEQRDNIDSEKSVKSLLVTILKNHILNYSCPIKPAIAYKYFPRLCKIVFRVIFSEDKPPLSKK